MALHDRQLQPMYLPQGGDPEAVNMSSLQHPGMLGGRLLHPSSTQGNKEYQLVQVDSTSAAPYRGAGAWWSDKPNYKVTLSTTNRGQFAGVFLNAPTVGNYTMIQTKGYMPVVKFIDGVSSTPDATGKFVIPSATAGKVDCLGAGSAPTYPVVGRSAGTYDAVNATGPVDLDVPEVA